MGFSTSEFQSSRDTGVPRQLLMYNALLRERHECEVASVLVVLTKEANSPTYTGRYEVNPPFGPAWEFGYTVVKVWEASADDLLAAPLPLAALAAVADVGRPDVVGVVRRFIDRAESEADSGLAARLFSAVGILLRMRYGIVGANDILSDLSALMDMEPFKQFTDRGRAEGRAESLREAIERQGRKKFGPPSAAHEAALNATTDLAQLEALSDKLLDVNTWDELLAG